MNYLRKYAVLVIFISPFGMAEVLVDGLLNCSETENSLKRLVCYDELVKNVKSNRYQQQKKTLHAAPVKVITSNERKAQQPIKVLPRSIEQQQANFGQENKQRFDDQIKQIKAKVDGVTKNSRGKYTITIDNGQVWQQTDGNKFKLKQDDVIIITRGAFGSFFIGKENINRRIRVKRVQ